MMMASGNSRPAKRRRINGPPATAVTEHDHFYTQKNYNHDQLKILRQPTEALSVPFINPRASSTVATNDINRRGAPLHAVHQPIHALLEPTWTVNEYPVQMRTGGTVDEESLSDPALHNIPPLASVDSNGETTAYTELSWLLEAVDPQSSNGLTDGHLGNHHRARQEAEQGYPAELHLPIEKMNVSGRLGVGVSQSLRNANLRVGGIGAFYGRENGQSFAQQAGFSFQNDSELKIGLYDGDLSCLDEQSGGLSYHAQQRQKLAMPLEHIEAESEAVQQISESSAIEHLAIPFNGSHGPFDAPSSNTLVLYSNAGANQPSGSFSVLADSFDDARRKSVNNGLCSQKWELLPKRRRRNRDLQSRQSKQGVKSNKGPDRPHNVRKAFPDEETRRETALTRQLGACLRCKTWHVRCNIDGTDPGGECLRCKALRGPKWAPCLRYNITDASVYREQDMPFQMFSQRWQTMDLVDITDWASDEVKTIEVTQVFLHAPLKLEVKKFIPVEGDLITEVWTDSMGVVRTHQIPPYALADMTKTAHAIEKFVDANIAIYINAAVGNLDSLLWDTYRMAFKHITAAKTNQEKEVLLLAFRVWVACRNTSNPHRISGDDSLGITTVDDPASPWHEYHPMPPLIMAQNECIFYDRLLRPLSSKVLKGLWDLVEKKDKKYWLTIYLTTFILIHSCSMTTRRDWEYARQISLEREFANSKSIAAHHMGATNLIYHFHHVNKGRHPFSMVLEEKGLQEVARAADLNPDQARLIKETALKVKGKEAVFKHLKDARAYGHDLYWVGQLYDDEWKPWPSHT